VDGSRAGAGSARTGELEGKPSSGERGCSIPLPEVDGGAAVQGRAEVGGQWIRVDGEVWRVLGLPRRRPADKER
jgi:hypothetical protein